MFWLISQAVAGVPWAESELQDLCVADGNCPQIVGAVLATECYGVHEDEMGAIITRYRSTIEVLENVDGIEITDTFILQTANYDYSQAEAQPNCYDSDPGHPVGEIARYYLDPEVESGVYYLYQAGTFYPTEDSDPGELPDCIDLAEESTEEVEETENKTGCASTQGSPFRGILALLPAALLWRRRR